MPTPARIREVVESKLGNEPETFQFLTHADSEVSLFHQLFNIDLRSLALLRVLLGFILLANVLGQFINVDLLYSEQGILTQSLNKQYLGGGFWSLLWINDNSNFAQALMVILALAAGSFVLGFQTRLMNLVCLILLWSLQVRNPLVLTGGGVLLRMLLFWSLFLPMSAIWSVDAHRADERPKHWLISSVATVAIMLQVVYMYFFAGLAKLNPFWLSGDAIEYAMNLEMSVKPIGTWLAGFPGVLKFATIAILVAEISTLFLMFIPRLHQFSRGALMGFFWIMHIAIWLTMSIGLFSITAIIAWVVFLPSSIWNGFVGEPPGYEEKKNYADKQNWIARVFQIVCGVFLVYVTLQNVVFAFGPETAQRFNSLQQFGRSTMTIQQFHMFSEPPLFSPWFEYTARSENGERADLFDLRHKNPGSKPDSVYSYMKNQTWRRLHWNLISHPLYPPKNEPVYREIRQRLLKQMVKRWNAAHLADPVFEAEIVCHLEPIKLKRINPEDRAQFSNHDQQDIVWASYDQSSAPVR